MSQITITDSQIKITRKILFGLFGTKEDIIDLAKVDYIVPRKGLVLKQYILIGERNGNLHKLRLEDAEIEKILASCKKLYAPFVKNLDQAVFCEDGLDALKQGSIAKINQNTLWITDDYAVHVPKRRILGFDDSPVSIEIKNIRFFVTQSRKKYVVVPAGFKLYFGTPTDQTYFDLPQKSLAKEINQRLIDNGAPLHDDAAETFKDTFWLGKLLKPFSFFKHEEIGLSESGIIYKYRKGTKLENIYLPYDKLYLMNLRKGLIHSNKIEIYGEQNIITKLQFSNSVITELKEKLKDKNMIDAFSSIRPTMWLGLIKRPFSKRKLFVCDDKLVFTDRKTKKLVAINFKDISNICWKKKKFYYFVGYLFLTGHTKNIRDDQDSEGVEIAMPKSGTPQKRGKKCRNKMLL